MGRGTLGRCLLAFAVALVPLVPSPAAAAPAPPKPIPGWQAGQPWITAEAAPGEVDVSRLPAVTPAELKAAKTFNHTARLVKDAAAYAAAKKSPKGPKGTAIPQKKTAAPAPNAPKAPAAPKVPVGYANAFTGISLNQELSTLGVGAEPSDTQMAAGPTTVMEMTNLTGQVFHKDGTVAGALFKLSTLFGFPSTYFPGDPRIVFDPTTQRYYATALGFNVSGGSQVRLAISKSSNPISSWYQYLIYSSASVLCDQPKLGYSSDKLIVGCTDFNVNVTPNVFVGGVIIAVNKSRVIAGLAALVGHYGPDNTLYGLVPAQNVDSGPRGYIVFNFGPDPNIALQFDAGLITVDGNPQAGFSLANLHGTLVPITPTTIPPSAPQSGGPPTIDTGDDRFMSAILQGGEVWTSGGTGCTPSGDTTTRACMKILKLGVAGNTNDLDTTTGIVGKYIFYPTLGLDANNNAAIDYSLSSASDSASHGAMIQWATDTTPTDRGLIQVGAGTYMGSRWGDYGAAATDPVEPTRVWLAGEYTDGSSTVGSHPNWNTGIAAIDFTSLSLNVTGFGFGPQLVGSASAAQTLTVTNSGDADVTIAATLADSSQFQATVNNCAVVTLAAAATCTAQFVFNPTSPGDKIARFNVSAPNYGPLPLVLSGTGLDPTCDSTTIGTNVTAPQFIGATVTLQASSAGCPNASPRYQFRLQSPTGVWSTLQPFGISATAPWNTTGYAAGTYLMAVYVKDASSTKAYDTYAFRSFTLQLNYCTATNFGPDQPSPKPSGTTITFTATRTGCPNVLYEWWLNKAGIWAIVPGHDYAHSTDTFIWNTAGLPSGLYQIGLWAKQAGSTKKYDAYADATYTLVVVSGATKCQAASVTPSIPSPQDAGTTVTLTATATSCTPQFKWWVRDPAGVWHVVADYPVATNTYSWTAATPGTYLLDVWVRQSGSVASYEAYAYITYTLQVAPAARPCTAVDISPTLPSPQPPGNTITFNGTAAGCASANYRWFVAAPGGAFVQTQPYGPAGFDWHTAGLAPGFYQIAINARRAGSAASYEAFARITFEIRKNPVLCAMLPLEATPAQIASVAVGLEPLPQTGCTIPGFTYYLRHGNTGPFVLIGTAAGPNGVSLAGFAGGWWTAKVLSQDPIWPGVFNGTVYSDFEVN